MMSNLARDIFAAIAMLTTVYAAAWIVQTVMS